jgi:hypothetical protein
MRAGRVAQTLECLPSKCETLSSNPVAPPKKKNKKKPQWDARECRETTQINEKANSGYW